MKWSTQLSLTAAVLAAFICANNAECAVLVIDDFSEPPSGQNVTSKGQQAWYNLTATVMGGVRDGSVGCESSELDGTTTGNIGSGKFTVTTNKKASPSMYLSYDSTAGWGSHLDSDPFNGTLSLPIDLTDGNQNDRFSITFASASGRNESIDTFNDLLVTVLINGTLYQHDYAPEANTWFDANYAALSNGTPATLSLPFSSLGVGLDMTDVDAVCLHVCSENYNFEYAIDTFFTDGSGSDSVPEPGMASFFLLGGALLALLRRRLMPAALPGA